MSNVTTIAKPRHENAERIAAFLESEAAKIRSGTEPVSAVFFIEISDVHNKWVENVVGEINDSQLIGWLERVKYVLLQRIDD